MDYISLLQAAAPVFAAFLTAIVALLLISRGVAAGQMRKPISRSEPQETAFLFEGESLVDASPSALRLLNATSGRGSDIARLVRFLTPRFPDLHDAVMASNELDALEIMSSDGLSRLCVGVGGGRVRLRLEDNEDKQASHPDQHILHALTDELDVHRSIEAALPVPVWRERSDGMITWANAAYLDIARRANPDTADQTLPAKLFDLSVPAALATGAALREQVQIAGEGVARWYDCSAKAIGSDVLFMAVPADRTRAAEQKLREFIATLTQTFAHLNVGLAIFDRDRRLTLFNPALTDLLGLTPEYLITHPSLSQFLDQLRDRQVMPEPKNYRSWRHHMSALEAAAQDGSYTETWALADGRTYRITGRPHPDGAVAFLFEDISAEISLTARFRAELETAQAVIDSLDEAIAVFSPAGYLTMSNQVYADVWDCDPSKSFSQISFLDATRRWQSQCAPTPVWGDARDFAATIGERSNWTAEVTLLDGRRLCCRFEALPGGATLAAFAEYSLAAFAPQQVNLEPARA